jgi:hypothetical protein
VLSLLLCWLSALNASLLLVALLLLFFLLTLCTLSVVTLDPLSSYLRAPLSNLLAAQLFQGISFGKPLLDLVRSTLGSHLSKLLLDLMSTQSPLSVIRAPLLGSLGPSCQLFQGISVSSSGPSCA